MVDQKLTDFLSKLGIDPEGTKIYLALVGKPAQTAQTVATATAIPKTTVYRRLDELITAGLVDEQLDEYKKRYLATPPESLHLLLVKKESEISQLRAELPDITKLLVPANQDPETKVLFYRGKDGIQQMNWNTLKTRGELVAYTYRAWEEIVGVDYVKKFADELTMANFSGRELYSDEYLKSRRQWGKEPVAYWPRWQIRYIPSKIIDITHQMDIYNDVVAIYNWHEGEVFGVEIYNQKVANMQRQIFDVLWKMGKTNFHLKL